MAEPNETNLTTFFIKRMEQYDHQLTNLITQQALIVQRLEESAKRREEMHQQNRELHQETLNSVKRHELALFGDGQELLGLVNCQREMRFTLRNIRRLVWIAVGAVVVYLVPKLLAGIAHLVAP